MIIEQQFANRWSVVGTFFDFLEKPFVKAVQERKNGKVVQCTMVGGMEEGILWSSGRVTIRRDFRFIPGFLERFGFEDGEQEVVRVDSCSNSIVE